MTRPLLCVVGPTASGKSALAEALCERLDGELISADSVQIYRHFDIGSAKPSPVRRRDLRHHLVDALDPLDPADAARFVELADACVADVERRGKQPVVCGGSFLWVRALVYGLAEAPPADASVRDRHRRLSEEHGRAWLHERLGEVDPASQRRLAPNDFVRVSRALEVFELTGRRLSEIQAEHGFRSPRRPVRLLAIQHERPALHERIRRRTLEMLDGGWLDEVRRLLARGYGDARAMRSVGYRQLAEALSAGALPARDALVESVCQATRSFARHQLTWLRSQPVEWLTPDQLPAFVESLAETPSTGRCPRPPGASAAELQRVVE